MKPYKIFFFAFSLIGFMMVILFVHENYHKYSVIKIPQRGDSICYFQLGGDAVAYYEFFPEKGYWKEGSEKLDKSEFAAYMTMVPFLAIYLWCLWCFIVKDGFKRKNDK